MDVFKAPYDHITAFNGDLRARYDFGSRVQAVLCIGVISAVYLHTVVRRIGPGLKGLLATVPVFILNIWAPMLFSSQTELVSRLVTVLSLFWLANFKAVGLSLNRGPIAGNNWNLVQMTLLYIAPMYPRQEGAVKKGRLTDSAGSPSKLLQHACAHAVALSAMTYMLAEVPMPTPLRHYVTGLALSSLISFIMCGPTALLTNLADLDVVPPFDKPWLSTSLSDWWSRRWNNTVSLTLRSLIYDPIVEGTLIYREPAAAAAGPAATNGTAAPAGEAAGNKDSSSTSPAQQQKPRVHPMTRLAGTAATFAVSGIMHEFILYALLDDDDVYPAGLWFMFFAIQVPLLVLEDIARRRLRKAGVKLVRPLAMGWFTFIILSTAYFFWYPPLERYTDVAMRMIESVNASAGAAVHSGQVLLQQLGLHKAAVGGAALVGSVSQSGL